MNAIRISPKKGEQNKMARINHRPSINELIKNVKELTKVAISDPLCLEAFGYP